MRHFENLPTRKTGVERDTTGLAFQKNASFLPFFISCAPGRTAVLHSVSCVCHRSSGRHSSPATVGHNESLISSIQKAGRRGIKWRRGGRLSYPGAKRQKGGGKGKRRSRASLPEGGKGSSDLSLSSGLVFFFFTMSCSTCERRSQKNLLPFYL